MFGETNNVSFKSMKPNKNFINLPSLTLTMNLKRKKWLLAISIPAVIGVLLIIFFSIFGTSMHMAPWKNSGCPHMTPNYILWISILLLIFAIAPISYYFISERLEERLEKNMKVISELVNENGQTSKKEQEGMSDKNIILKLLNSNERKVLESLIKNEGTVLQSEISRAEGMNKLKTHRAVKRLKQKGIIKKEDYGKTNRIILTEDIKDVVLE